MPKTVRYSEGHVYTDDLGTFLNSDNPKTTNDELHFNLAAFNTWFVLILIRQSGL